MKTICGSIYRENRIQESGVRIQEKSGSCLFSWTGAAPNAMSIYRENPFSEFVSIQTKERHPGESRGPENIEMPQS
jgi:hypothetical protein